MLRNNLICLAVLIFAASPIQLFAFQDDPFEAVSRLGSDKYFQQCEKLEERVDFEFENATSAELIRFLKSKTSLGVELGDAVQKAGLNDREKFSIHLSKVSIRTGLQLLLRKYNATYTVRDKKILIAVDESKSDDSRYVEVGHEFGSVVNAMMKFQHRVQSVLGRQPKKRDAKKTDSSTGKLVRPVVDEIEKDESDRIREKLAKHLFKIAQKMIDPRRIPDGKFNRSGTRFVLRSDTESHFLMRELKFELLAIFANEQSKLELVKRRNRLFQALQRPTNLDMRQSRVSTISNRLRKVSGVSAHVDSTAIDAGIYSTEKIRFFLMQGLPASLAFERYLELYQLGYSITSDAIIVSQIDDQSEYDIVNLTNLRGVIVRMVGRRLAQQRKLWPESVAGKKLGPMIRKIWASTEAGIVETIRHSVRPDAWEIVGGDRKIGLVSGVLVVKASPEMHREIESLIQQFHLHSKSVDSVAESVKERRSLRAALDKKLNRQSAPTRFGDAVEQLHSKSQKQIFLDASAARRKLNFDRAPQTETESPTFAQYFRQMVKETKCKWGIWNGQLLFFAGPDFDFHETTVYNCVSIIERRCANSRSRTDKSWEDFEEVLIRQIKTEIQKDLGESYWDEGRHIGCVQGLVVIHASGADHLRFARMFKHMK